MRKGSGIQGCIVNDCHRPHFAKGYCRNHYRSLKKFGHPYRVKQDRMELLSRGLCYCTACKKEKSVQEFKEDTRYICGYRYYCKSCELDKSRKRHSKSNRLKTKFNITLDTYNKILEEQNNRCVICNTIPKDNDYCVDHCHKSGKIRGILCRKCNLGLGHFNDDIDLMQNAIRYLAKSENNYG